MKRRGKIWFFIIAIIIFFLAITTVTGMTNHYGDTETPIIRSVKDIRFGIDIRGGVDVSFIPAGGVEANETQMSAAQAVIEQRLVTLGITDYEIYKDVDRSRIILRFPWKEDETEFNPETAIQELAATAMLTFREGNETDSSTGAPTGVTEENIILEGSDVTEAKAQYGPVDSTGTNEHYVQLTLNEAGTTKFAEATERLAPDKGTISIWMDNTVISAPTVNSTITDGSAIITGEFDAESAKALADKINAGSLPFALEADSFSTISPILGSKSLQAMTIAGIVAFIIIVGFMIINYRLPGCIASISLLGQTAGTLAVISGYFAVFQSSTLTLPGIAGIILAIGIGVDANVITGERIKEELRGGKKLDTALRSGFQRGLAPIIDSNVTVLIVAAILMGAFGPTDGFFATILKPIFFAFGPSTAGTIYSFGQTLLIGVILNFVFGVFCTRVMLTSISKIKFFRKPTWYGALKEGQEPPKKKSFNIVGKAKNAFILSGVIIVAIVVLSFVLGVRLDIQFRGGALITYSYTGEFDTAEGQAVVNEALGSDANIQLGEATDGTKTLAISLPGTQTVDAPTLEALTTALEEAYPDDTFEQLETNNVEPSIGQTFLLKCLVAVIAAFVIILIYIAIRFRKIGGWMGGLTAIVALAHDLVIVYGVFVILQIPLSGNFIAALLTILGYSINDTVVIYDRVRENRGLLGKKAPFPQLVNDSINQSLKRSINTTVTTLLALMCVCIFSLVYGLDSIFSFAFPMMIGMVSGVYSTVCIAGPLWVRFEAIRGRRSGGKGKKTGKNQKAKTPKVQEQEG